MTTSETTSDLPAASAPKNVEHPRSIRSFVRRSGRLTTGQAKAFAEYGEQYVLPYQPESECGSRLQYDKLFGAPRQKYILEIGFGMGDATALIARKMPDAGFIACEVHEPGVGALLRLMGQMDVDNIRIFQHDAVEVMRHMLPDATEQMGLDGVHIFFPDPWHKKKHHKRRLIQTAFLDELLVKVKTGGYIHCATDWEEYAIHMAEVMQAHPQLQSESGEDYAPTPDYRPDTKFERRGQRLGHGVWDLVYRRTPA